MRACGPSPTHLLSLYGLRVENGFYPLQGRKTKKQNLSGHVKCYKIHIPASTFEFS